MARRKLTPFYEAPGFEMPQTRLPEGYVLANPTTISYSALSRLSIAASFGEGTADELKEFDDGLRQEGKVVLYNGARIRNGRGPLVAANTLYYRDGYGESTNLVTHPGHRHRGIARALIADQVRVAADLGLHSVFIESLEPDNPLRSYYHGLGFVDGPEGELLLGPDARAVVFG